MSSEEERQPEERGPRGGRKHQPGRGHDRKSTLSKKKRFARRAAEKRRQQEEDARQKWAEWDALPDAVKRLLGPACAPKLPRPSGEG
jgi:hypothetical protein